MPGAINCKVIKELKSKKCSKTITAAVILPHVFMDLTIVHKY